MLLCNLLLLCCTYFACCATLTFYRALFAAFDVVYFLRNVLIFWSSDIVQFKTRRSTKAAGLFLLLIKDFSNDRTSCPEVFCEKVLLRNFVKFTAKYLCQSLYFNKVAGLLLFNNKKRESGTGVFLWILWNF